jgi:uncharacterized protein YndB with AHSA1/START domain
MKIVALGLAMLTASFAQDAPKPPASVKVTRLDSPKALKFEIVLPAKIEAVWDALTTSAGLNTWLWKECTVDLREGGGWIVHYPGGATGGGTIVSLKPGTQLVIHAMAPEKFPEVRSAGTTAAFDLDADGMEAGERVGRRVRVSGWRQCAIDGAAQLPLYQGPDSLGEIIRRAVPTREPRVR